MTKLAILTINERTKFNAPPKFNQDERALHFSLSSENLQIVQQLRSTTTKVGFILQLGYFRTNGKFYTTEQFRQKDIFYVTQMLGLNAEEIDLSSYKNKIITQHRRKILTLLGWQPFNKLQKDNTIEHVKWLVQRQMSLKHIFLSGIDFCWQNKVEVPSFDILSDIIINGYNNFEYGLIDIISNKLTPTHIAKLDKLVSQDKHNNKTSMQRPSITLLKQINQSLRPADIQETVEIYKVFKEYFDEFSGIIDELKLSDQATEYFATWVQKATVFQLNQFANKNKLYLYLLCYIKHQCYYRHDILIDLFLKSVRTMVNAANDQLNQLEKKTRPARNLAIKKISTSNKNSREVLEKITGILKSPIILESAKLAQIEATVDQYNTQHDASKSHIVKIEQELDEISKNKTFFDALESMSLKLQNRVSNITKVLEINTVTSEESLVVAIQHYRTSDADVGKSSPVKFLKENEANILYIENKFRVSLYKALLFVHMADAIKKSSHLNFIHSYRYKAIQEYLIDEKDWQSQREKLLFNAGLDKVANFNTTIDLLKTLLDDKYKVVNERFLNGKNQHLKIDNNGKTIIATPSIESDDTKYIASLLTQIGVVPIIQVLTDINAVVNFTNSFKHFSIKYKKMKQKPSTIFAGIIGKGCNIGVDQIANISVGVLEDTLKNTINWCFSLKNIQSANNKIIYLISKLLIANNYRHNIAELHTSSDGRKVNVSVDSILASHSFKYFGKDKGVTVYTYLDERQLLYHFTVISSSEREAAYVIDGLLQNDVIKSSIHSTDTHGYTESVFAGTYFINTAFAPRIKNIGAQTIYGFSTRQTYENRGYKILPSRTINLKLIENNWDDILRFMATMKLKYSSASQLFKRLSSYAKDHPLYRAIKEFGRIIKSIFILTYFDDVELRQRIEKQLNKVEQSNKFANAVFFDNNGEFKYGLKEEQEIAAGCKVLIQNAVVLWNYLYLSQLVANINDLKERKRMFELIRKGSVITWQHINFKGEYDFTRYLADNSYFDMAKIKSLQAA